MYSKILLYIYTILNLKFSQIVFQIYYRLLPGKYLKKKTDINFSINPLKFFRYFEKEKLVQRNTFEFLNLSKTFEKEINWDFQGYGKLWNYNLQYFDYLFQPDLSEEDKIQLLRSFYRFMVDKKMLLEPYPVSLRAINCIKFYSQNQIQDNELLGYLYQELSYLHRHYEYHIMGNHLLENAFAMLMGGVFFQRIEWSTKAQEILKSELTEQILKDGGHFEQSPMYHNIILFRVLELIDSYSKYSGKNMLFLEFLKPTASKMISWLRNMSFENGEFPHFNDSADGICLSLNELVQYSQELSISVQNLPLGESGYRKYKTDNYECIFDIGAIKPIYQPGHSHADSFSFWLHKDNKLIFGEI